MLAGVVKEVAGQDDCTGERAEPVPETDDENEPPPCRCGPAGPGAWSFSAKASPSPLVIQKTDGGYLYATTDLAAIKHRVGGACATRLVYAHDARQTQRFAQLFDAACRAGWAPEVTMEYAPFGTMLGEDNKPFKTRSGGTVKLKELLEEAQKRALALVSEKNPQLPLEQRQAIARAVGIGAVKYADLSKDRVSDYVFSCREKMLAMDGNTAPYLQYAYARIRSIFRKAGAQSAAGPVKLDSPYELSLAKHIVRLGEVIDLVGRELKPHYLCTYLYELHCHAFLAAFLRELSGPGRVRNRCAETDWPCADLTARTMGLGLDLLGIEHPDQM